MDNVIFVNTKENPSILKFVSKSKDKYNSEELPITNVFVGRNGTTFSKREGDGKTPLGIFDIGIVFGTNERKKIKMDDSLQYIKINENLHWIDDTNSKYYNQLVDITKINIDWESSEHLIDYCVQYEYAIEIKTNPKNIPGKGSAIFIHCSNGSSTAGCVAMEREKMIKLLEMIDKNTKIIIK